MFKLTSQEKNARAGVLQTAHGSVATPFFMPIATKGTAKQLSPTELEETGAQALIANAFILSLRPGLDTLAKHGGLHTFMQWNKSIFTDSGGFQILSKSFLHKANDKGVHFKNPYTGERHFYTPEDIIAVQEQVGADVLMTLDFVPHYNTALDYIAACTKKTHDWAARCKKAHTTKQLLFGICQGGTSPDLRKESASFINSLDFDGIALGGLCIGEGRDLMFDMIKISTQEISTEKPRYLMGVGSPEDLLEAINLGIDCFDSRFPTMNARHGGLFTAKGKIDIEKSIYKHDETPLHENCDCFVCKHFSKAFLHHLYKTYEPIRDRYGNIHNLHFIHNLLKETRKAIKNNEFHTFKKEFYETYKFNKDKKTTFTYA